LQTWNTGISRSIRLGEHALSRASRLARPGYIALACDLHGDRQISHDMNLVKPILEELRSDVPAFGRTPCA
jgi:dienelactone hydrolase